MCDPMSGEASNGHDKMSVIGEACYAEAGGEKLARAVGTALGS